MKVLCYNMCILAFLILSSSYALSEELARVNEIVIKDSDFVKRVKSLSSRQRAMPKKVLLYKLIEEELLQDQAKRLKIDTTDEYKSRLERAKRRIMINMYINQWLSTRNTKENQKKYYEENKERYRKPGPIRISVILLKTEEEAQEVLKMANAGEDFAELAKKYSIGSTAENGGDLGFLNRGQLSGAIARVVYGLKKGEIGGPAKTKQGYHIIKLTDWRPGDILTFEEIRDRLAKEYKAKLINNRISELRDSADIHINNELLEGLQID